MDAQVLKRFLNTHVELIKKNDTVLLRGFIREIYLDSILFITQGRERVISCDEISEIRQIGRTTLPPPTDDFYYQGNGKESWKRER